jgi:hypothetical protein
MTYYIKNGTSWSVASTGSIDLHKELPAGNYIVKQDMFKNLYLEQVDAFKPIEKIYGDTLKTALRMINTFHSRENATGVLLAGEKGSGKTLKDNFH